MTNHIADYKMLSVQYVDNAASVICGDISKYVQFWTAYEILRGMGRTFTTLCISERTQKSEMTPGSLGN
jgi:hypothetical protein